MLPEEDDQSLGEGVTAAWSKGRLAREVSSLGDEQTVGGTSAVSIDTIHQDFEVVELESRYTIEGPLGQGGMGAVLLATDTRLGRKVAIKRISGEAARSKTAIMRFLTEAKAIAALNHPNIVQVYDYGRAKDGPFLIMEFVDGGSLADRCKQGAIPLEEAVELACQICDGLAKAHDAAIVHRDIKPANVLLTKDGAAKLTDFGLAKAETADHGMTMTGAVMGTPDFMPPEQRRDVSEVDHRSDLWSLAASVYQMVTGRSPKIIRFNDVPVALQDVLAKALEDRKDSRYQSAREFRDALKTSLRAATTAVEELVEGACPSCGVKNDSSRRFCRGCGESLEAPCLSCTKPMPMWEEICGSCGAKQTPLVDERRHAMAAKQAEAEGLLGDFEFDRATSLAAQLQNETHPKLKHLTGWATAFLEQIEKSRAEQTRHSVAAMAEAVKHEAAHDYLSAVFALETIPEAMRTAGLPGMREPPAGMLDRIRKTQAEVKRLESLVKERLASKQVDELLPDVERLLALRPDREDIQKLRSQLLDRQQKQAAGRDEAIDTAKARLAEHDYEGALVALNGVAAAAVTPDVTKLREQAEGLARQVRGLARTIKNSLAAKNLDGLLDTVEQYLKLKPVDEEFRALRQSLVAREEKFANEIQSRLEQARTLEQACRFDDVCKLLAVIPEARCSTAVREIQSRAEVLGPLRQAAMQTLSRAEAGAFGRAVDFSEKYRKALGAAGLADEAFAALRAKTEAEHADEVRAKTLLFRTGLAAAALAVTIVLVGSGIWIRSLIRSSSLAAALAQSRWDDAINIDADNSTALVGRAQLKLAAAPPDVEGAFADLERAERNRGDAAAVRAAWAEAFAARAREQAKADRLEEAEQDLAEAVDRGATAAMIAAVKTGLATGWLNRSAAHLAEKDATRLRMAVAGARRHGVDETSLAPLVAGSLVLEGVSLQTQGDGKQAVEKLIEASLIDAAIVNKALQQRGNATLRQAVVADYRAKFDAALADNDWERALRTAAAAEVLDATASQWVGTAIAAHPGGLSAVPADVLGRLPATVISRLPPTMITALPAMTLAALPPRAIAALPPLRNSIGIELKLLPPGRFTMGQVDGHSDETPHQVTLTQSLYLGVHEVTNAQWQRVMGSVPSNWKEADRPVEQVSWSDAVEFCGKLSALPEERRAGRDYRLPTEGEWEYACRAGSTARYCFGDDESRLGDYGWFNEAGDQTHPVGKKQANAWGLFDMHGNVWEWCSDWYGTYGSNAVTDPQGPSEAPLRVFRGGSWGNAAWLCRSAYRSRGGPSFRNSTLGFRLALSPSGAQPQPPEAAGK